MVKQKQGEQGEIEGEVEEEFTFNVGGKKDKETKDVLTEQLADDDKELARFFTGKLSVSFYVSGFADPNE